jgi:hypothetical protein
MSFEASLQEVPRHFGPDGDLLSSHIAACLSAVYPDGEGFFVRAVRRFRRDITDPVLKQEVGGFIGQEAIHGREHRAFHRRLSELGYPTRSLFGHDKGGELLVWHALEESEHKTVAFDVHRAVGGTEHMRRVVMDGITTGLTEELFGADGVLNDRLAGAA